MIPILILAAGASSRMRGTDKLLLDVDGIALLRRQARMALSVSTDVRLTLPPRPHARYDVVQDMPVQTIEVADAADGLSASVRAAFASLEPDIERAMILLADLPDLTADDLRRLMQATQTQPNALIWRGATPEGTGGHPMIVARHLFDAFQSLEGDAGGQSIVKTSADRVHLVPFSDNRARADLDTPEAWAAWRAARAKQVT